jgi:HK97 family phage major capsid protein
MSHLDVQRLKRRRANVWAQMQEVTDEVARNRDADPDSDGWTDELRQKFDRADAEIERLNADIEREQRATELGEIDPADDLEVRGGPTDQPDPDREYRDAFSAFVRFGRDGLSVAQRQLLASAMVPAPELRALGTSTGAAGGYTVPKEFWEKITEALAYYASVASVAERVETTTGADLQWPSNDDTANKGAILAENAQVTEQDLTFGGLTLAAYIYTSKLVRVSLSLMQDSAFDVEAFLARKLGERIGRALNEHLTVGTGTSQPQGFVTGATVGKTTASATAITYGEIIDLEHSVDFAYRNGGRCRYMFHDQVFAYLRKLLDGQGRPLWQPSVQAGAPDTFNGHPYTVNNFMDATVTTGKKTIAFGDFTAGYVVRSVSGGQLLRLDERYADFLQVGFLAFGRFDGRVQNVSAIKLLQQA